MHIAKQRRLKHVHDKKPVHKQIEKTDKSVRDGRIQEKDRQQQDL